jgi:hypothetical protein
MRAYSTNVAPRCRSVSAVSRLSVFFAISPTETIGPRWVPFEGFPGPDSVLTSV